MTFIFKNKTIFWDISKWNMGQTKWDGGSTIYGYELMIIRRPFFLLGDY